jgi:hypothetical protein
MKKLLSAVATDAGIHEIVSAYLEEPSNSGLPTAFLRAYGLTVLDIAM